MPLNIKHPEADQLARALAENRGQTITEAVISALREQLQREEARGSCLSLKEELLSIGDRCAALPEFDTRNPDEIMKHDEGE